MFLNAQNYLGVSRVTFVPAGEIKFSCISPRRCDVRVILACTCSKKFIEQYLTLNRRVMWLACGITLQ